MKEKGVIALFISLGAYIADSITMLTVVFFVFMIIDLLTGILGSKASGQTYDKKKAENGVYKKLGYLIFWFVGVLIELIIKEQGAQVGINIGMPVISVAVTAWLVGTEGLSITSNLHKMGVTIPKSFANYFDKLQKAADKKEGE